MELSERQDQFAELGLKVAAFTYEPPSVTIEFSNEWKLHYPILYDENAHHVKAFDVINPDYDSGHSAYGIPLPGIFLISPAGRVQAKFYRKRYQERPEWNEILQQIALISRKRTSGE